MSSSDMLESDALSVCDEDQEQKVTLLGFVKGTLSVVSFAVFLLSGLVALVSFSASRGEPEPGLESPSLQLTLFCVGVMVVCYAIGLLASRIPDSRR